MEISTTHAVAAVAGALAAGWTLGRWNELRHSRHVEMLRRREREESDKAVASLRREIVEATQRRDEQLHAFQVLPDIVEEMFRAPSRRAVVPLLMKLVDALLRPEQGLLFVARAEQKKLAFAEGIGLLGSLKPGVEVDYGRGRVGYVAETMVAMDEADFRVKRPVAGDDPKGVRADALAPVVVGEQLFAVLVAGAARQRRGLEKRLLSMAGSLASAAIAAAEARAAATEGAQVDGMTGLLNRRSLEQRLDAEVQRVEREGAKLSVLLVDVDELRHYNQTNGAQAGDEVLKRLAALLKSSVRGQDLVGRFGGEEMVVVFPGADKETALRLADQIRRSVEDYPFAFRGLQPTGKVTISGGVATYPEDARGGRELLRCADQAMADAKSAGRNRVHPAEPSWLG